MPAFLKLKAKSLDTETEELIDASPGDLMRLANLLDDWINNERALTEAIMDNTNIDPYSIQFAIVKLR